MKANCRRRIARPTASAWSTSSRASCCAIIQAGSDPEQTAVTQDGRRLFVANEDAGQTSVIEISDGRVVGDVPVGGEPEGVDLRPDGKVVYVTSEEDNQVAVIDAATAKLITTFKAGPRPRATGFLPDSSRAYISAENGSAVIVVDAIAHKPLDTIKLEGGDLVRPMGVIASADGKHVFVTTGRGKSVVIIDTATNKVIGSDRGRRAALGHRRDERWHAWYSPRMGRRTTYRSSIFRVARWSPR